MGGSIQPTPAGEGGGPPSSRSPWLVVGIAVLVAGLIVGLVVRSKHHHHHDDAGCSATAGTDVPLYGRDGAIVTALQMCTNAAQTTSVITNLSTDEVWYVNGYLPYWTRSDDAAIDPTIQIFRAALRTRYAEIGLTPYLTIEPGLQATLDLAPSSVHLSTNAAQQSMWQTAVLLADAESRVAARLEQDAKGTLKQILIGNSPTRKAMIDCAIDGYNAGNSLTALDPSKQLFSQLNAIYRDGYSCIQELRSLEDSSRSQGVAVELPVRDVQVVGESSEWIEPGDKALIAGLDALEALIRK